LMIKKEEDATTTTTTTAATTTTTTLQPQITFVVKYGKEKITIRGLNPLLTIGQVKGMIHNETNILPIRQKLIGLSAKVGGTKGIHDELSISELAIKNSKTGDDIKEIVHQFILMGTPEEKIFIDPTNVDILPNIIDDFDFDFNAGSPEWVQHCANDMNLKQFTNQTSIHIMNEPRPNKPLLVLDLDHTLLDFSSKSLLLSQQQYNQNDDTSVTPNINNNSNTNSNNNNNIADTMKRPFMDDFLIQCYYYYDIVIWSQTSWRWLETKLIELNMITHPGYKFCFVLDKVKRTYILFLYFRFILLGG
jgi:ubiquitin-like domain-containing CTD phosphatase 1